MTIGTCKLDISLLKQPGLKEQSGQRSRQWSRACQGGSEVTTALPHTSRARLVIYLTPYGHWGLKHGPPRPQCHTTDSIIAQDFLERFKDYFL